VSISGRALLIFSATVLIHACGIFFIACGLTGRACHSSFCGVGLLAQAETTGRCHEYAIELIATIF